MIPVEFVLFGLTLLGVALLHHRTLEVALAGLAAVVLWKFIGPGFESGPGFAGFVDHLAHEWVVLANLFALLTGFTVLARHFEQSHIPDVLPALLPDDWKGGFTLLAIVFVLSAFLDNIAAAMIGGTIAATVFRNRLHIGYLAAIVAASNAGGSGSVIGDTTTTMMWLEGIAPVDVLHAYVAAAAAFMVFAIPASLQQQSVSPIVRDPPRGIRIDWTRVAVVGILLATAVATNVTLNLRAPELADTFPFLGAAVWLAILLTAPLRRPDWVPLPSAVRGSLFLLALVLCASLMPVESLPVASWPTTLGLGFLSAVFDNIPLTKLALEEGGYDWGFLAYAVGYGGSMIWFGSSAGVALSNRFPDARSVGAWLRAGWHVAVGYVVGFLVLWLTLGWRPEATLR
jgi:Na+/H+ antiporter NhaD/arsenite permease-like protein